MWAKLMLTMKTCHYKKEEDFLLHSVEMEKKGFRLWKKIKLGNLWTADYVKDRFKATK